MLFYLLVAPLVLWVTTSIAIVIVLFRTSERMLVSTGIAVVLPKGVYGRVAPRSGLAVKHGIQVGAGVIDPDYTGEVKVVLFNHGEKDFEVKKGDRIAQLVLREV
jgi:dUTP pyrophosphatase